MHVTDRNDGQAHPSRLASDRRGGAGRLHSLRSVAQPVWGIRGGDDGKLVDRFLDGGYTAVAFPELGDGRTLERYDVIRTLERAEIADPPAVAARFQTFVHAMSVGDPVLIADPGRKDMVIGVVDGDYEFHDSVRTADYPHRRPVRWVGRHDRDELPPSWADLYKQRPVLKRYEAASLTEYVTAVLAGEIGRPATQRAVARVRVATSPSSPRAPRAPRAAPKRKAPVRVLRRCPGCGFNWAETVFEGQELCRDCRD